MYIFVLLKLNFYKVFRIENRFFRSHHKQIQLCYFIIILRTLHSKLDQSKIKPSCTRCLAVYRFGVEFVCNCVTWFRLSSSCRKLLVLLVHFLFLIELSTCCAVCHFECSAISASVAQ